VFKRFEVYVAGDDPLVLATVFRPDPPANSEELPAHDHDHDEEPG